MWKFKYEQRTRYPPPLMRRPCREEPEGRRKLRPVLPFLLELLGREGKNKKNVIMNNIQLFLYTILFQKKILI